METESIAEEGAKGGDAMAAAIAAVFPPTAAQRHSAEMTAIALNLSADNARLLARIEALEDQRLITLTAAALTGILSGDTESSFEVAAKNAVQAARATAAALDAKEAADAS